MTNHTHWAKVGWIPFVSPPVRAIDIIQNVLLFLPAGLFAARPGTPARSAAIRAVVVALPVSFAGEATQLWSHGRFPSATDLVCNLIGAALGAWIVAGVVRRARAPRQS